jgi:hypothetical protein
MDSVLDCAKCLLLAHEELGLKESEKRLPRRAQGLPDQEVHEMAV